MNPKKHILNFLNSPKCSHPDDSSCDNCERVQRIIDGMSMGTATLVIDRAASKMQLEDYEIAELHNKGRYYTARIVDHAGAALQKLLVDKQTGDVRFV